jgi:hypothetical protein
LKDSFTENYKALIKEITNDTNEWKVFPSSWTGRINSATAVVRPTVTYPAMQYLAKSNSILLGFSKEPKQPK